MYVFFVWKGLPCVWRIKQTKLQPKNKQSNKYKLCVLGFFLLGVLVVVRVLLFWVFSRNNKIWSAKKIIGAIDIKIQKCAKKKEWLQTTMASMTTINGSNTNNNSNSNINITKLHVNSFRHNIDTWRRWVLRTLNKTSVYWRLIFFWFFFLLFCFCVILSCFALVLWLRICRPMASSIFVFVFVGVANCTSLYTCDFKIKITETTEINEKDDTRRLPKSKNAPKHQK